MRGLPGRKMPMAEWSVRVFGPKHQIRAAVECLSSSDWAALGQSGDEWYMTSIAYFDEESGALFTDKAQREIEGVNTVCRLFNSNDSELLTLGVPSYLREGGTRVHFQSAK